MIQGGWTFVWTAYGLTMAALGVLALVVVARLRHWARRARELER